MERDRADVHPAPRAELAGDVIDHLLRLKIRVVVRDRRGERIEIELARTERADHEVPVLERLMRRRRLVEPAGGRLEVVHRERPRIKVAVPSDGVGRLEVMMPAESVNATSS